MSSQAAFLILTYALVASTLGNERINSGFVTSPSQRNNGETRTHRATSHLLYKAPSPYQSPGRPHLNSFIVTSRPLDLAKGTYQRRIDPSVKEEATPSEVTIGYRYLPRYKLECDSKRGSCSETITVPAVAPTMPTFKPHTTDGKELFDKDARRESERGGEASISERGDMNLEEEDGQTTSKGSKATLWYRPSPHRPPDHDKKGWIPLDPVPWSSSKISKWTADKDSPGSRPPEATRRPWISPTHTSPAPSYGTYVWHGPNKPQRPQDSFQSLSSGKPQIVTDGKDPEWPSYRPPGYLPENNFNRPGYHSGHYDSPSHRPSQSWMSNEDRKGFPHRRPQNYPTPVVYHDSPSAEPPSMGDHGGQWVVFSDRKEYKPKSSERRSSYGRSMKEEKEDAVTTAKAGTSRRRSVRLTVLPSEGAMETSHNGMIEVDGSKDTVDEDRRKRRLLLFPTTENESKVDREEVQKAVVLRAPTASKGSRAMGVDRAKTVMAAVGVGMVPATVAALLPMMLAKRERRSVVFPSTKGNDGERLWKIHGDRKNLKAY